MSRHDATHDPPSSILYPLSSILVVLFLALVGCQPAARYPDVGETESAAQTGKRKPLLLPANYSWLNPHPPPDIPIQFVAAATRPEEWKALPEFWNHPWGGVAGQRTVHLGLSPLGAVVALRLSAEHDVIKIKVPLGLPDPTPNIPAANPPTLLKWRLGKRLFFDKKLLPSSAGGSYACATCHDPAKGYTEPRNRSVEGRNAPTLINAVYNKHQFWDGRATYLEEVVQRTLEDESVPTASLTKDLEPEYRHVWFNVVGQLRGRADYLGEFERVFGTEPTQDNVAKALATYVRTILSGDAVYDRAEAARQQRGGTELEASDFAKALDPVSLKALTSEALSEQQVGAQLDLGHRLFLGHGRCVACHKGPLFTDHDFHNIGVGESRKAENILDGKGNGYFAHAPTGLKDKRYIGAFKTPTLRALPRTAPYMHRGEFGTLRDVLRHYNTLRANLILTFAQHLDPILLDGPHSASDLRLEDADLRRLELFLKALDGGPVPPKVAEP